MSVATIGDQTLEPFLTPQVGEPIGTLIGSGLATGDATGGTQQVTWTLGDFVYVFRMVSGRLSANSAAPLHIQLETGFRPGGESEAYTDSVQLLAAGAGLTAGHVFIPASIFCSPRDQAVTLGLRMLNQNGIALRVAFRALVFPQNVLQVADPSLLARFII